MSGFHFTASQLEVMMNVPMEPPDKGRGEKDVTMQNNRTGDNVRSEVSFRDKVLGISRMPQRERVDLVANKLVNIELVNGNRLLPMLNVEEKLKEELSLSWKDALVVKRLSKPPGFNVMMRTKLVTTWKLMGSFDIMDIGNGYFMVIFKLDEGRTKVINGGPWMIYDHYLSIRTWAADFNASRATIDKTMVWVRIPSLNLLSMMKVFGDFSISHWKACEG